MNHKPKILLAHPGRQHSFRVAKALKENGLLFKYATTVYNKEDSFLIKLVNLFLSKDNKNRAKKRKCPSLTSNDVVLFNQLSGFILLLLLRIDYSKKIYYWFNKKTQDSFGKKVARFAIKHNVDAVICYDTNSLICFKILEKKAPQIKRVLDHSAVPRNFLFSIFTKYQTPVYEFYETIKNTKYLIDKKSSQFFAKEILLAHYHIVASNFTAKGLKYNSISDDRIFKIPYGINEDFFSKNSTLKTHHKKLNILFVGEFSQKKGIQQFLEAAIQLKGYVDFNHVGYIKPSFKTQYHNYLKNINVIGYVLPSEMKMLYSNNDIFIFPSMGDGFGLVLLEAMAAGLPIIASKNCAGPDLIKNGYNGFLIDAGSTQQLVEKIQWFQQNPEQLSVMSKHAKDTAKQYTWEIYENRIVRAMESITK